MGIRLPSRTFEDPLPETLQGCIEHIGILRVEFSELCRVVASLVALQPGNQTKIDLFKYSQTQPLEVDQTVDATFGPPEDPLPKALYITTVRVE